MSSAKLFLCLALAALAAADIPDGANLFSEGLEVASEEFGEPEVLSFSPG